MSETMPHHMPEPLPGIMPGGMPDCSEPIPDPKPARKKIFVIKSGHEIDELADKHFAKGTKKVTTWGVNVLEGNVKPSILTC